MSKPITSRRGVSGALLAAVLFGISTPLAKALSPQIDPVLLAGLLYLGSGIGLGLYLITSHCAKRTNPAEAKLVRQDVPWLAFAVFFGGLLGPALLMWGLAKTPASSAALLLNLEGALTALLAWFAFRENFDLRIAMGMLLIVAGGICLSWMGRPGVGVPWRSLAVVGACLAWAIDNNLTRKISTKSPAQIAMIKGLVAGSMNTALAVLVAHSVVPRVSLSLAAGILGFFGYGVSLVFFIRGLRDVGTARTSAYFSTAPFIGAAVSVVLLGEKLSPALIGAAVLMSSGVWLHLTERHEHKHRHEPFDHDHLHVHDEHHQHAHGPHDPPGEPHTHRHHHDPLVHTHPHFPDIHHRHSH